jgi:hypothetical protein
MRILRHNPDVIALAILGLLLFAPAVAAPHATRSSHVFQLTPAGWSDLALASDPAQINGLEDLAIWTTNLELRGERVWQRLSDRMRRFEQRFEKYSTVQPRSRSVYCEAESE